MELLTSVSSPCPWLSSRLKANMLASMLNSLAQQFRVFWSLFMAYYHPSRIGHRTMYNTWSGNHNSNIGPFCIPLVHVEKSSLSRIGPSIGSARWASRNPWWMKSPKEFVLAPLFSRYHISKIASWTSHDNDSAFLSYSGVKDFDPGSFTQV